MFLSPGMKNELDVIVRKNLPPALSDKVIEENRAVRTYLIQQRSGAIKVSDHCYTKGSHWETLKKVKCDWDDAIAHKAVLAKASGLDATRLRIIKET